MSDAKELERTARLNGLREWVDSGGTLEKNDFLWMLSELESENYAAATLASYLQQSDAEIATLRAQLAEAVGLLKRLSAEVFALNAFEHGVRFQIGNTNYAVLTERAKDAREFIERVGK